MSLTLNYGYVQLALWGQLFLWFNLYHAKIRLEAWWYEAVYFVGLVLAFYVVQWFQPTIGYFTPLVLSQYIFFLWFTVIVYRWRFGFRQALCLSFLTVFLNSFYWELFYHVHEFQIWLPISLGFEWWYVRLPQWIRVLPAFFLVRNFEVTDTRFLGVGLVGSFILTYLRFVNHVQWIWLQPLHRGFCLATLVATIYISSSKEFKVNDVG